MTGDVPFVEVACVKDYPGSWAEYRVFEGGVLQVHRRLSSPAALAWSERVPGPLRRRLPGLRARRARRPVLHPFRVRPDHYGPPADATSDVHRRSRSPSSPSLLAARRLRRRRRERVQRRGRRVLREHLRASPALERAARDRSATRTTRARSSSSSSTRATTTTSRASEVERGRQRGAARARSSRTTPASSSPSRRSSSPSSRPTEESWGEGDRETICVAVHRRGRRRVLRGQRRGLLTEPPR